MALEVTLPLCEGAAVTEELTTGVGAKSEVGTSAEAEGAGTAVPEVAPAADEAAWEAAGGAAVEEAAAGGAADETSGAGPTSGCSPDLGSVSRPQVAPAVLRVPP